MSDLFSLHQLATGFPPGHLNNPQSFALPVSEMTISLTASVLTLIWSCSQRWELRSLWFACPRLAHFSCGMLQSCTKEQSSKYDISSGPPRLLHMQELLSKVCSSFCLAANSQNSIFPPSDEMLVFGPCCEKVYVYIYSKSLIEKHCGRSKLPGEGRHFCFHE